MILYALSSHRGDVLSTLYRLQKSLVKIVQDPTKVTVKHAVTMGLTEFSAYYDPMKTKKCYSWQPVSLLPCYQLKCFNKLRMVSYKLAEGKVKQEYIRVKQNATTKASNSTALEDLSECEDGVTVGLHEYDRFNLTVQLGEGQTDLNYWKNFLAIPASNAGVERLFSWASGSILKKELL
ncbi:hypothetical protein BT69DRAFT_1306564 [Atractiella rhizophila]|nr:hypothetical protein BT69DRAFT_1306564 [Atractiella rhizophila]